jgi:hypothetical protein
MRFRWKKPGAPGKFLVILIIVLVTLAIFTVSAYAQYHPTVTIMGRVTHGTDPVWGVVVTANTTSEQGTPTGNGTAMTDSVGFYQIVLDKLDPDAGYYQLTANYSDYQRVNYRGVAYGKLSSGVATVNILLTNASERATFVPATPTPTAVPTVPAPSVAPGGDQGRGSPCCGLFILLPITVVCLVVGQQIRRHGK